MNARLPRGSRNHSAASTTTNTEADSSDFTSDFDAVLDIRAKEKVPEGERLDLQAVAKALESSGKRVHLFLNGENRAERVEEEMELFWKGHPQSVTTIFSNGPRLGLERTLPPRIRPFNG